MLPSFQKFALIQPNHTGTLLQLIDTPSHGFNKETFHDLKKYNVPQSIFNQYQIYFYMAYILSMHSCFYENLTFEAFTNNVYDKYSNEHIKESIEDVYSEYSTDDDDPVTGGFK